MSLDTEKLHKLKNKGFTKLYSDNRPKWNEMAENATTYAKATFDRNKERVHPGDVAAILRHSITIDPQFEKFVESKNLSQKYWSEYFSDYIVEQRYGTPKIE